MDKKETFQRPGSSRQKKAAVINDMAGFGRCALTVALPVISRLKVQCCPVPTAILSNHTAYPDFFLDDYTDRMEDYLDRWRKLGLTFDGIGTGFLSSEKQIGIAGRVIRDFRKEDTVVVVDPVMGDNGKLYAACTRQVCREMIKLAESGDIVTPNVTECCILTGRDFHEGRWKDGELLAMARDLAERGPGKVVITGVPAGSYIGNFCYERKREAEGCSETWALRRVKKAGESRCGTGDIFSAVILADAVNKVPLEKSVKKAADFISLCIRKSEELEVPLTDGVCFEEVLDRLKP